MTHAEPDNWDEARGAEIYAEVVLRGVLHRTLARRLVDLLAPAPAERFLDLAAGTGILAELVFARTGPAGTVVALDRAPAMARVAARSAPLPQIAVVVADPAAVPLASGSLDGAACSAAFWHFPAPARVFAEVARALREGGRFAMNIPAAQLTDVEDLPPVPLQLALAREGERLFGQPPEPGGPVGLRSGLVDLAAQAGLAVRAERCVEVRPRQQELLDLLSVPAIGGRLYPDRPAAQRRALFEAAAGRVDLSEEHPVRWLEWLFDNRPSESRPRE